MKSSTRMRLFYETQSKKFFRLSIPQREFNRTNYDRTAPLHTPALIGCAFAVDTKFFFEIGGFDDGMEVWGGENIEIALRVCFLQYVTKCGIS